MNIAEVSHQVTMQITKITKIIKIINTINDTHQIEDHGQGVEVEPDHQIAAQKGIGVIVIDIEEMIIEHQLEQEKLDVVGTLAIIDNGQEKDHIAI